MADYFRTFWQRFSLSGNVIRQDYMGNAEYEWGSVPNALKELRDNVDRLEVRKLTRLPFKFEYYPSHPDQLAKPRRLTFIGTPERLDYVLGELEGKTLDNKAGLLRGHRSNATLIWLACEPNTGERGGYLVLNEDWIDELEMRDQVNEMLVNYFGINLSN